MMRSSVVLLLLAAGVLLTACNKQAAQTGAMPPIQVVAARAQREPVSENLSLVGTVAADEIIEVRAETDGTVQDVNFEEGKPVQKRQLLVQLDPTKLKASLAESEAAFKLTEANFQRMKTLQKDNVMAQQEYDQAASAYEVARASLDRKRRDLEDTEVRAPFAGVMGSRMVSPGQVIDKDTRLSTLVALDPVKIEVNVPERFIGQAKLGQKIEVKVAAYPNETFKGEVFFIAPQVDPVTRTVLVKARMPNADFRLKPGMFARLDLTLKIRDDAVVIPEDALILSGDSVMVFIIDDKQTAQIRMVKPGVRMAGKVEIIDGLKAGEQVIVEGHQKTRPGGQVKVANGETTQAQTNTH